MSLDRFSKEAEYHYRNAHKEWKIKEQEIKEYLKEKDSTKKSFYISRGK